MNSFDAAVYACLAVAIISGFRSGLLRSLATIFGYVAAAPVALAIAPYLAPVLNAQLHLAPSQNWLVLAGLFTVAGIILGALMRIAISEMTGPDINIADRGAGAALGAIRILLLAVLLVLIFDRIIPPDRQPEFLIGSKLRPILSAAGQQGLRTLPPDVTNYIDRMKRERGL